MGLKANVPLWRVASIPPPAAGADPVFTRFGDATTRLMSLTAVLTTSAAVATRAVRLEMTDGQTIFFRSGGSFTQPANTTYRYSMISTGADFGDPATVVHLPSPSDGMILLPGWRIAVVTANIQAGDQWSASGALVEEFPNGPDFEWVPGSFAHYWERS